MVRMAGFALSAIAFAALMAAGCAAPGRAAGAALDGTTWRAETIMGRPVIATAASTITFEADGRVHGQGGCNRYFGAATIDGERMSLWPPGSPKLACAPAPMDQK